MTDETTENGDGRDARWNVVDDHCDYSFEIGGADDVSTEFFEIRWYR
jgi:hypothetical protein